MSWELIYLPLILSLPRVHPPYLRFPSLLQLSLSLSLDFFFLAAFPSFFSFFLHHFLTVVFYLGAFSLFHHLFNLTDLLYGSCYYYLAFDDRIIQGLNKFFFFLTKARKMRNLNVDASTTTLSSYEHFLPMQFSLSFALFTHAFLCIFPQFLCAFLPPILVTVRNTINCIKHERKCFVLLNTGMLQFNQR